MTANIFEVSDKIDSNKISHGHPGHVRPGTEVLQVERMIFSLAGQYQNANQKLAMQNLYRQQLDSLMN